MTAPTTTRDALMQLLANQDKFSEKHVILDKRTDLLIQICQQQEKHLASINSHVAENQKVGAANSLAVAVALEKVQANSDKISMIWKIFIPISTAMIGAFTALILTF